MQLISFSVLIKPDLNERIPRCFAASCRHAGLAKNLLLLLEKWGDFHPGYLRGLSQERASTEWCRGVFWLVYLFILINKRSCLRKQHAGGL